MTAAEALVLNPYDPEDPTEPSTAIKDIDRIGEVGAGVDNYETIKATESDALAAKLQEYKDAADNLADHHAFMSFRFDDLFTEYLSMFATLDVLSGVGETIKTIVPKFQFQEEFSFFSLEGEHAEFAAKFSQAMMWGGVAIGGAGSLGGVWSSYSSWKDAKVKYKGRASKLITDFRTSVIPKENMKTLSKLGRARVFKGLGVAGAALGVVGAGLGIYATMQNEKARRTFLVDSVFAFQNWYDDTQESYLALKGGVATMEDDFREMMALLGIAAVDDPDAVTESNLALLKAALQDASVEAGKHSAKVSTAARIFCRDDSITAGTVISVTGLKPLVVADIQAQIQGASGPAICALVD